MAVPVIYKFGKSPILFGMNLITAVIEPDADGTLHLPLPPAWRHQSIRVRAELEPVGDSAGAESAGALKTLKGFGCLQGMISMAPDFNKAI